MTFASGMRVRRSRIPTALEDGGTGSRTREEAAAALGVPSLTADNTFEGDNTFTGTNTFSSPLQAAVIASATEMTLVTPEGPRLGANATTPYVWLDLTGITDARTMSFPDTSGTFAVAGAALKPPYVAKSGTYGASSTDCVINCTGTWTLTLPTAVGFSGQFYYIKNSGAGTITMAGTGGQTFDGVASPTVTAGASLTVCSDGANWLIF